MLKTRIYIFQILGIIVLLLGYMLSDQPDSLSIMHFDPNPACPSVFTKASKEVGGNIGQQVTSNSQNNSSRKTSVPKFFSYEVILTFKDTCPYHPYTNVPHASALPENYEYLFYEEINPPPPKAIA